MLSQTTLAQLGVPTGSQADRSLQFPDGAAFRVEIPSVEGPRALEALLKAAADFDVTVNRIAQGSGGLLLRANEIRAMAEMGHDAGLEVSLFVGPRAGSDIGVLAHSPGGAGHYAAIRGSEQLLRAAQDVERSAEEGIRSFLVGDLGLLKTLSDLRARGHLPSECIWKVSAYFASANPVTVRILEELGAGTINVPSDLAPAQIAELRAAVGLPLDVYIEAPDSMGGTVRIQDLGQLIEAGAPLYAKFGLRNAGAQAYPTGLHVIEATAQMATAKVHRAAVALEWLARSAPLPVQSKPNAQGLAVPQL